MRCLFVLASLMFAFPAAAQTYPGKPVKVVRDAKMRIE